MSELTFFASTFNEELYSFKRPTTVILSKPWTEVSEPERALLSKILQSVQQSLASVTILGDNNFDLSRWSERPERLIGFGIQVKGVSKYEVITTPESQMVLSDSLEQLTSSDELKKRLWIALKQLFFS